MRVSNITLTTALVLLCTDVYAHSSEASPAAHAAEHFAIVIVLGLALGVLCALCRRVRP